MTFRQRRNSPEDGMTTVTNNLPALATTHTGIIGASSRKGGGLSKIQQLMGDLPPSVLASVDKGEDTPWFLRSDYTPQELVIDSSDGSVKGGTLPALVERLTAHEHSGAHFNADPCRSSLMNYIPTDMTYITAFLMTFKSFTTVDELFDLLVQRFWIQPPPKLTPPEREKWGKLKQHIIQSRYGIHPSTIKLPLK